MNSESKSDKNRLKVQSSFVGSLRGTLLAWFLVLALVPIGVISALAFLQARQALSASVTDKLRAVREKNASQLRSQFKAWEADVRFISQHEQVKNDLVDMAAGYRFLGPERLRALYAGSPDLGQADDGSAYSLVHQDEHRFFGHFMESKRLEDILLLDPAGRVIYSHRKGPDFAADLTADDLRATNLSALYETLKTIGTDEVAVADTAPYQGGLALFMGSPIARESTVLGFLVLRLPVGYISDQMQTRLGMGATGETYVVGPDNRMRSNSAADPEHHSVAASLSGTVAANGVDTEAARQALAGNTGSGIIRDYRGVEVLSAWTPADIPGLEWVVISEMDLQEALAPVDALAKNMALVLAAAVLLASGLALLVSGRIVAPIRRLTVWMKQVADGDLSLVSIRTPRNEIGVLNDGIRGAVVALQQAQDEEARQNWLKSGRGDLDDAMRGEQSLDNLCRTVITFVAKYVEAQVGALFLRDDNDQFHLQASYAYTARKHLSSRFNIGEGLVGQAALEKQSILLTQVPEDYVAVTSGLGEKTPRNILVSPLVLDDTVVGVLELGTFEAVSGDRRLFLEEITDRVAIALNLALSQQKLRGALETTQRQAEELQSQQEELKTANEELEEQTKALRASEERLKNQQEELQVTNEELEEKTELLEKQKAAIEKSNRDLEEAQADLEERAEELNLASKYKSEFLANMSHELRTPLNSLLLLSESLCENKTGNLDEDQQQSLAIIRDSGTQLLNLINDILDLSKIEAGRMELKPETVLVGDLAERLDKHFQHLAQAKDLELSITVDPSAPAEIDSDGRKLEQVLRNLVSNAVKFTEDGSVAVTFSRPGPDVRLRRKELQPDTTLAVSVTDTGIGIPPEQQKIVFEAFQQADGGTARRYGGTGLGLSISKELTHLLGGEIQLDSQTGKGSTFRLYLPQNMPPPKAAAARNASSPAGREATGVSEPVAATAPAMPSGTVADDRRQLGEGNQAILIIEDDQRFARILQKECRRRGFQTLVATSGEEGIRLAQDHQPEAVVLDIRLPGISGWVVLQQLKENPDLRHIPVHIMSVEEMAPDVLNRGAVGYLKKPVNKQALEQAFTRLEDLIERKVKKLLVVEDDPGMQDGIVQIIGNGDVETRVAGTGEKALQALRETAFDCVILDLGLPDISGFEVLKTLQEEGQSIPPVIVYTGRQLSTDEERELQQVSESIIVKGVRSEERLLDEASLFLHRMVRNLPDQQRRIITDLHNSDAMFKDKTVLMVDDDMRNVFALSKVMADKGLTVLKAENGQRALEMLERHPDVDLVLMDIMMPVMDGYAAMEQIRSRERFQQLPIIALTAKAMVKDREACIAAGANDYITKPVDVQRLLSMLRVWLYQ